MNAGIFLRKLSVNAERSKQSYKVLFMINANHQSAAVFKDKKTYNLQAYIDSIGVDQHSYKRHTHT